MDNITLHMTLTKDEYDTNSDIAKLSQQLIGELVKLNIESVDFVRKESLEDGTKAGDVISWETLIITLAASGGVISTFINFILGWAKRNEGRTVVLELNGNKLEVAGLSSNEQKELVETWFKRNGGLLIK